MYGITIYDVIAAEQVHSPTRAYLLGNYILQNEIQYLRSYKVNTDIFNRTFVFTRVRLKGKSLYIWYYQ